MESPEFRAAFVAGRALDPTTLIDEEGNTLLHNAKTGKEITLLLHNPLIEVDATNKVRIFVIDLLVTIDIRSRTCSRLPHSQPPAYSLHPLSL